MNKTAREWADTLVKVVEAGEEHVRTCDYEDHTKFHMDHIMFAVATFSAVLNELGVPEAVIDEAWKMGTDDLRKKFNI